MTGLICEVNANKNPCIKLSKYLLQHTVKHFKDIANTATVVVTVTNISL